MWGLRIATDATGLVSVMPHPWTTLIPWVFQNHSIIALGTAEPPSHRVLDDGRHGVLRLYLRYYDEKPVIRSLERVSRPGRRIYKGATELRPVRNGLGIAIVSTSKGLMTDKQARQQRIGGEVMALVW